MTEEYNLRKSMTKECPHCKKEIEIPISAITDTKQEIHTEYPVSFSPFPCPQCKKQINPW